MNWKGYGRKQSWPNLRYYPGICLEGLTKTTKTSVRIAGLQNKIRTQDLPPEYEAGPSFMLYDTTNIILRSSQIQTSLQRCEK
jgi:hypothetical protein